MNICYYYYYQMPLVHLIVKTSSGFHSYQYNIEPFSVTAQESTFHFREKTLRTIPSDMP